MRVTRAEQTRQSIRSVFVVWTPGCAGRVLIGLDPEIRVAASNVGLERLANEAPHALNFRGIGNYVKFARKPSDR